MPEKDKFEEIMNKWAKITKETDVRPSPKCLPTINIIEFVDNLLEPEERERVINHLSQCNHCTMKVASAFRAKEEITEIVPSRLTKDELKRFFTELANRIIAITTLSLSPQTQGQLVSAEDSNDLRVTFFEDDEEKSITFKIDGKLIVDDEGQLAISMIAPDESFDGQNIKICLMLDENRKLVLGVIPVLGREAFGVFETQLEPHLEIPHEMIIATIEKTDNF